MNESSERPVCVVGVGRSGTSLTTRAINLLGIELGPERTMLSASDLNPLGFWEQQAVIRLNEEILSALGGTWWNPVPQGHGWQMLPEMDRFRPRIQSLVSEHFDGSSRWGIKDPRLLFTLPLWEAVVGEMDCIVCIRNPLDVVASGDRRALIECDLFVVWAHFNCDALRLTAGRRRTFVFYDDWFVDPVTISRRLAQFLHGEGGEEWVDGDTLEQVAAAVDPALHRNRAGEMELAECDDIAIEARVLYFLLRDLAEAESRGEGDRVQALQAVSLALDPAAAGAGLR